MSHLPFNLDKLMARAHRRSSEPDASAVPSRLAPASSEPSHLRNRARSLSMMSNNSESAARSRSRSISKSVPRKATKELIKQETNMVIARKVQTILKDLGLQNPIPLALQSHNGSSTSSKSVRFYVANSNDCVYLAPASSASFTYEDVENGGMPQNNSSEFTAHEPDVPVFSEVPTGEADPNIEQTPRNLIDKLESFNSPNYLCSKIDSEIPIPHTFAVVVELLKDTAIKHLKIDFASLTNITWPSGDPYNKTFSKDAFCIGKLEWFKSLNSADYYINTVNSSDCRSTDLNADKLADRTRFYRLYNINDTLNGQEGPVDFEMDDNYIKAQKDTEFQPFKAGLYVFILPILLPQHIPPTVTSINGSLNHLLNITAVKVSDKLNRKIKLVSNYNLPLVRTPPSFANSIADKPIYVNRVWNDSLHYVITFPKKYVALGNEHVINVKLVPLVKDVIIKRIKFNVLERMTYVSRDLSREYDYDGEDPYLLKPPSESSKIKERVVCVCELKTKNKATASYLEPYKEEVIKCPNNNLLFSCYEPEDKNAHDADPLAKNADDNCMIASPLDINIALPFLTTRNDKIYQNSQEEEIRRLKSVSLSNPASRKASIMSHSNSQGSSSLDPNSAGTAALPPYSPIIGALETNLIHNIDELNEDEIDILTPDSTALMHEVSRNHFKENVQYGFTTIGKALYPDSNYRHIQIHHRLQVCFRISKPDPNDNYKMHHYEVVVDTPLILLSSKCNEEAIQLPKYDDIDESSTTQPFRPPAQTSISFRTPKFDNTQTASESSPKPHIAVNGTIQGDGFMITPFNLADEDTLPSFEEATSGASLPIVRSMSIPEDPLSRTSSIIPDYPAPAYEYNAAHPDTANIDEVVGGRDNVTGDGNFIGSSKLRTSLVSSFAPLKIASQSPATSVSGAGGLDEEGEGVSLSDRSGSLKSSETQPSADSIDSSNTRGVSTCGSPVIGSQAAPVVGMLTRSVEVEDSSQAQTDASSTAPSSVSNEAHGSAAASFSANADEAQGQAGENDDSSVTSTISDTRSEINEENDENITKPEIYSTFDDSESVLGSVSSVVRDVGTFDQRIPLLRNASSAISIPYAKNAFDPRKDSTDTMFVLKENEQQDIYHAYK